MNGVEILSIREVVTKYAFNWQPFWITVLIMIGICAIIGLITYLSNECEIGVVPSLALVGLFFGVIIGYPCGSIIFGTPIEYTTEYKVIISDEVNFNEFQEKYEIISQEGKIYTIEEKK